MNKIKEFHIIAMAAHGPGFSGGDRIFIELAKRWKKKFPIYVYLWEEGRQMCKRQKLESSKNLKFVIWRMSNWCKLGFCVCYVARIMKATLESFRVKLKNEKSTYVYSASDFWMDTLPGWILKMRYPRITWVGTFYLTAPSPFRGFREKGELRPPTIKGIFYWLQQQPMYWLTRLFSNKVCVTSEPDTRSFPKHKKRRDTIVVRGGVNVPKKIREMEKIYDGIFLGRFHPQKGVVELTDIWKKVIDKKPGAKLAMIGNGPLMNEVKEKIKENKLEDNIKLFGYLPDGSKKYTVFSQSKIFMHSAVYDSGGMSCAEGMAWGMPGISFDLEALKTYYPKGVLKAPIGNLNAFAKLVLKLLENDKLYKKTKKEAVVLVNEYWDWDKRAKDILKDVIEG